MGQSHKKYLLLDLTTYSGLSTTEKNAYSFYVSLMLKFNNNVIYKATNKRLSELTVIHINSVSKYINILKKWSYVKYKDQNLHIEKIQKEKGKKLYKSLIYRSLSAKKIKQLLEIEILRYYINQQAYRIEIKELSVSKRKNKVKKLKNAINKNSNILSGAYNKDIHFSYRYAAKKLNVSIYKIQKLLKIASDNHIIKTKYVYKFLTVCKSFQDFKQYQTSFLKTFEGYFNLNYNFNTKKVYLLSGTDIKFKLELL